MPPKITFVAPVIRRAIATLQANLDDQIAIFNAEAANTVDLVVPNATPSATYPYGPGYAFGAQDPLGVAGFPVVEVSAVDGRSGQWSIGRTEFDHDIALTVVVWHEGDRGELAPAYEMSLGLARCVIECLSPPDACGDGIELAEENAVHWRADALPADLTNDEREFLKWRVPVYIGLGLEAVERFQ